MSNDYIIITYAQVCAKTRSMVLLYLLYNVAIELNYVNVLTEEMSFIFLWWPERKINYYRMWDIKM